MLGLQTRRLSQEGKKNEEEEEEEAEEYIAAKSYNM